MEPTGSPTASATRDCIVVADPPPRKAPRTDEFSGFQALEWQDDFEKWLEKPVNESHQVRKRPVPDSQADSEEELDQFGRWILEGPCVQNTTLCPNPEKSTEHSMPTPRRSSRLAGTQANYTFGFSFDDEGLEPHRFCEAGSKWMRVRSTSICNVMLALSPLRTLV